MLGVVDALLFRPPAHVVDVNRVVDVRVRTYPDYVDIRDNARSFSAVGAWALRPYTLMEAERAVSVSGLLTSSTLFPLLGVHPAAGRFFTAAEDRPGGPHVLVLGFDLWQRHFGATPGIVGSTVRIAGDVYSVVGVAPDGFTGPSLASVDAFLPITTTKFDAGRAALVSRDYSWVHVVARLAPGVTRRAAEAETRRIYAAGNPGDSGGVSEWWGGRPADVRPLAVARRDNLDANIDVSLWLAALATAVLGVACVNVAGLLLARALRGRVDLAVRAVLGAERLRLVALPLCEGTLLAIAGAVVGVAFARAGGAVIRSLLLNTVVASETPLDARTWILAAGIAVVAIVMCGAWPALVMTRGRVANELAGGRGTSLRQMRARYSLAAAQLALALVLVISATLFVASVRNARTLDIGMSLDRVVVAKTDFAGADYTPERGRAVLAQVTARLSAIRGVRSVAVTGASVIPGRMNYPLSVPNRDSEPQVRALRYEPGYSAVTSEFFATVGTPIVLGRGFSAWDWGKRVIIVSEPFARLYWPDESPLGQCVKVGGADAECAEVIGVSKTRRAGPNDTTAVVEVFVLLGSVTEPRRLAVLFPAEYVAARLDGDADRIVPIMQRVMQETLPDVPNAHVEPAYTLLDRTLRPWRLGASVFSTFGLIAAALALLGVYATIAYSVAQRTREMGIRIALGASAFDIALLITSETARVALVGAVAGLVVGFAVARAMAALLFGISPLSPVIYVAGGLTFVLAAISAGAIPAWRAAHVRPAAALRSD